jgi:hypothetical protein
MSRKIRSVSASLWIAPLRQGKEFLRRFQLTTRSAVRINHESPPPADNSTSPAARKGAVKAQEAEFCEKANYLTGCALRATLLHQL